MVQYNAIWYQCISPSHTLGTSLAAHHLFFSHFCDDITHTVHLFFFLVIGVLEYKVLWITLYNIKRFELEGFKDLVECIFLITNNGIHNYKILLRIENM